MRTEEDKKKIEADLIKQAKEGKQSAYTKLYEKYKKSIHITIFNIVKNNDVADDLLNVTFIKAFGKLESYVNYISFEMWLKTIAVNSSIDFIRKVKKEKFNHYIDDENSTLQLNSNLDRSPEDDYIFAETSSKIESAIERLKPRYKAIFTMKIMRDLSYKEIAQELSIPENAVKSDLNKARKRIRELININ